MAGHGGPIEGPVAFLRKGGPLREMESPPVSIRVNIPEGCWDMWPDSCGLLSVEDKQIDSHRPKSEEGGEEEEGGRERKRVTRGASKEGGRPGLPKSLGALRFVSLKFFRLGLERRLIG